MVLIDISPPLRVGMGVFPGDAVFQTAPTFTIGPNCPVNVAEIAMSTHCGAHADAPLHYDPNGASIDQLDLADFIGPARVIDARGENPLCGFDEIAAVLDGAPPRLLFRLMDRLDPMVWPTGFRALAPDAVERLREKHHIYMTSDSRMNLAGIMPGNVDYVAAAFAAESRV